MEGKKFYATIHRTNIYELSLTNSSAVELRCPPALITVEGFKVRLLSISKEWLKYQLSDEREAKVKYQNIFLARRKERNTPKERHVANSSYWKLNEELKYF